MTTVNTLGRPEGRDRKVVEMSHSLRGDVAEILAGAVLELLVARTPRPLPVHAQSLPKTPKSAISRQIRGSL
jgi:hypothetical protein